MCQEPPVLEVILGEHWRFPSEYWLDTWKMGSFLTSWYVILDLRAKFQLSSMNKIMSRTPCPWSHTWRMLKVPDWRLRGWGHPWHVESSGETPRNLFWKFCDDPTSLGWDIELFWLIETHRHTDMVGSREFMRISKYLMIYWCFLDYISYLTCCDLKNFKRTSWGSGRTFPWNISHSFFNILFVVSDFFFLAAT